MYCCPGLAIWNISIRIARSRYALPGFYFILKSGMECPKPLIWFLNLFNCGFTTAVHVQTNHQWKEDLFSYSANHNVSVIALSDLLYCLNSGPSSQTHVICLIIVITNLFLVRPATLIFNSSDSCFLDLSFDLFNVRHD